MVELTSDIITTPNFIENLQNQIKIKSDYANYKNTYISLVTETFFYEDDYIVTEKVYKPMSHFHPFIIIQGIEENLFTHCTLELRVVKIAEKLRSFCQV